MPANIGHMFYTDEAPWHNLGTNLPSPATVTEALKAGNLDWTVGEEGIQTIGPPSSPCLKRKALVREDIPRGNPDRVLGVVHKGFRPLQNHDGAMIFDSIFGHGKPVYNTGGWLGNGNVVWLLAEIHHEIEVCKGDWVKPYALYVNSHDGSKAFSILPTSIRVVCQNTLNAALRSAKLGHEAFFRRAHKGSVMEHKDAARDFFRSTVQAFEERMNSFKIMSNKTLGNQDFSEILEVLYPEPKKPESLEGNSGLVKAWEKKCENTITSKKRVFELLETGKGMELQGSRGTYWGALNAVLEYEDHHRKLKGDRVSHGLLGKGMETKRKSFELLKNHLRKAA